MLASAALLVIFGVVGVYPAVVVVSISLCDSENAGCVVSSLLEEVIVLALLGACSGGRILRVCRGNL